MLLVIEIRGEQFGRGRLNAVWIDLDQKKNDECNGNKITYKQWNRYVGG